MTTFSIRYETGNSARRVGIVNNAPTAGDALEVWALANGLKIKLEVEFKEERQPRAYAHIKGGRTGRLIAYAFGDKPLVAGEIERKYPGPKNKNPYPKLTIPVWREGSSNWRDGYEPIQAFPAGDLAHKPLVDYEVDFPGDDFHRPGEPQIVDIPRNPAGITTVEAEYDRAMIAEGKRDRAEHPERYCDICDLPREVCTCWEDGGKIGSAIYVFADELQQCLDAVEREVEGRVWEQDEVEYNWAQIIDLVGLDLNEVIQKAESEMMPFPLAAKRLFQMTLGVDPDDSEKPWPPEDEIEQKTVAITIEDGQIKVQSVVPLPKSNDESAFMRALEYCEQHDDAEAAECMEDIQNVATDMSMRVVELEKTLDAITGLIPFMLDDEAAAARVAAEAQMGELGRQIKRQTMSSIVQEEGNSLRARLEAAFLLAEMRAREIATATDEDDEYDTFDGLTLCPIDATPLKDTGQNPDNDIWYAICPHCHKVWRWDDEGYWEDAE